jgi:NADP-dependent 3-hydroxy acid dehydrogenase YdfG
MPQTLLVTGASAGIGRATAERFLEAAWSRKRYPATMQA